MELSPTANRLIQAEAHASADPRPTGLRLWRDGVAVEMWDNGRRVERRVTWADIETEYTNPLIAAIDACSRELSTKTA